MFNNGYIFKLTTRPKWFNFFRDFVLWKNSSKNTKPHFSRPFSESSVRCQNNVVNKTRRAMFVPIGGCQRRQIVAAAFWWRKYFAIRTGFVIDRLNSLVRPYEQDKSQCKIYSDRVYLVSFIGLGLRSRREYAYFLRTKNMSFFWDRQISKLSTTFLAF